MYQGKGVTFDAAPSQRETDENGFLHVGASHITKATVNPYYGREIPGWQEAGLDPEAVYYGLRDPEELQASLETWAGLPLHIEHHIDSAEEPQKLTRVGAVGTGAVWNPPYVDAPLTVWDRAAIDAIEDGSFRELSCAYRYDPDFTPGSYEGIPYDFIMRNIRGNHVALVEEGRAGPDVVVADSHPTSTKKGTLMGTLKKWFRGAQDDNPDIEKQEVELAQAIIDLHKVDPVTGEIVDVTEDEDKAEEIRKLVGDGKAEKKEAMDEDARKAMDACGLDAEDPAESRAFAEGVKYGEKLERNPEERRKLDREHESEGMKKAMDACGLDAEGHYSSARDVAVMSLALLRHPKILEYSGIWMDTLRGGETQLTNTNKMLKSYAGITGLKTGTTNGAGVCISASAVRGGMGLLAVVLGSPSSKERFASATAMLDYGFATFEAGALPQIAGRADTLRVTGGVEQQVALDYTVPEKMLLKKGEGRTLTAAVVLPEKLDAPVAAGTQVASVTLKAGEEILGEYPVTTRSEVPQMDWGTALSLLTKALFTL